MVTNKLLACRNFWQGSAQSCMAAFALTGMLLTASACSQEDARISALNQSDAERIETYYEHVSQSQGRQLLQDLNRIIRDGAKTVSYNAALNAIKTLDADPDDPDHILLIYTGESRPNNAYTGGNGKGTRWNREHVWPQSRGLKAYKGSSSMNPLSDLHHLWPSDVQINSNRGNRDFDEGGKPVDGALETFFDKDSFEPNINFKGEVARALFYMAVQYPNLDLSDKVHVDGPVMGKLCVLLDWNELDPVSDFERNRNDGVHKVQKNRNPFIDHPEWARQIWGDRC